MDMERIRPIVDQLFVGRDEVSRRDVLEAIDRDEELDPESRTGMRALTRERYTREELIDELRGLGRDVPIGAGGIFGGAG